MRIGSLKSIYLTEKELKQAIANWIELEHKDTELAIHLEDYASEMVWSQDGKEFIISMDGEFLIEFGTTKKIRNNIMTQNAVSEQNNDRYLTKVQEAPNGELFVELPQKLIDQLGWEVGDDIEWGETRLPALLTLSNQSKKFRDATEAFRDYDLKEPFQGSIAPKEELERAANEEYNDGVPKNET